MITIAAGHGGVVLNARPQDRQPSQEFWTIDRFEGGSAVCSGDERQTRNVPRALLPADASEGDVLVEQGQRFRRDDAETARRREAIKDLTKGLWA